jgi:choline dehydrogenase-like flavoprotein
MIHDVHEFLQATDVPPADVVVVGGGFAGIEVALRLGRAGAEVLLLESGGRDFDPRVQDLVREISIGKELRTPSPDSPFTPYLPAIFRGESRLRQLGGTSNIWTGKWRAFDPLDLAHRPWIPGSGWPIDHDELAGYYRQVVEAYGLEDGVAFAASPEVVAARRELGRAGLTLSFHYWQQQASRPGSDRRAELAASEHVRVVVGATVTELLLDADGDRVDAARVRSLAGGEQLVRGRRFVLATGGIEVPRLLLASDAQRPGGIGNDHDLVGRFHMDHPKTKQARLYPGPAMRVIEPWTHTQPRPRFHVSIELDDAVQREEQLLDHAVYLAPSYRYLQDYPDDEVAAVKQATARRHPAAALRAAWQLARTPGAVAKVLARTRHRDRGGPVDHYVASMYVEQAPDPDSRILLSEQRDELGMRRPVVDWQLSDLDHRSFGATMEQLRARLARAGLGRFELEPRARTLDGWVDAAHHMGATRMATRPEDGVVDPNGCVHGTANLYVASSSVFPTGHSAAPTMTILALAIRLGEHLIERTSA